MTDSPSSNEHLQVGAAAESQTPPVTLQRLHQRLLQPFGVIDTQRVHRHSAQAGTTAARLMRRLDLPEQIQSRYESGVVRNLAFSPRFNGQRTELSGLGSEGLVVQRSPSGFEQGDSDRSHSSFFQETSTTSPTVEPANTPTPRPKQLVKVIKSAQLNTIQLKESQAKGVVQRTETPLADSTSDLPSGLFRISRRTIPSATVEAISVLPPDEGNAATSTSSLTSSENSPSSSLTTEFQSDRQELPLAVSQNNRQELPLAVPTPTQSSEPNPISAQSSVSTAQPQIQGKLEVSPQTVGFEIAPTPPQRVAMSIQQRYRQADLVLRSPVVSDEGQGGQGTVFASPVSPSSSLQFDGASTSREATNSQSLAEGTNPLPVVKVSSLVTPSVQSKSLPRLLPLHPHTQRGGEANSYLAATPSVQESRPLYTPLVSTTLIQRQEAIANPAEPSLPVESSVGTTSATSPPVPPAASEVDVAQIAEQVSRILYRRTIVERERRGLGR